MLRKFIVSAAIALLSHSVHAAVITSNSFDTGNEGWRIGELFSIGTTSIANWDSVLQRINTEDTYSNTAFFAPTSYLGNQSASFGGTIEFDLGDAFNDAVPYSPLALISGTTVLYANRSAPPSTTNALTKFVITLTGQNFFTGHPYGGATVQASNEQLQAVLSNLDNIAIFADWKSGDDFSQLDNVSLRSLDATGEVPEPSTLPLVLTVLIIGLATRKKLTWRSK